jgi:hypothetical protein
MAIQGGSTVGPGEYKGANIAACEPQVDSRKLTAGSIKFGTGYRKGVSTHKSDLSEPSPGPGTYPLPGGMLCFWEITDKTMHIHEFIHVYAYKHI